VTIVKRVAWVNRVAWAVLGAALLCLPAGASWSQAPSRPPITTMTIVPGPAGKSVPPWLDPGRGEYCRGYQARGTAIRGRLEHARQAGGASGQPLNPEIDELLNSLNDALVGTDECPGAGGARLPSVAADSKGYTR
jgi:hypothetical protein